LGEHRSHSGRPGRGRRLHRRGRRHKRPLGHRPGAGRHGFGAAVCGRRRPGERPATTLLGHAHAGPKTLHPRAVLAVARPSIVATVLRVFAAAGNKRIARRRAAGAPVHRPGTRMGEGRCSVTRGTARLLAAGRTDKTGNTCRRQYRPYPSHGKHSFVLWFQFCTLLVFGSCRAASASSRRELHLQRPWQLYQA